MEIYELTTGTFIVIRRNKRFCSVIDEKGKELISGTYKECRGFIEKKRKAGNE